MLESDPFNPLVYWPHVVLGIGSVFAVLFAVFSAKGSKLHRTSGIVFSFAMGVAAITAVLFSVWRFAPPALFSSISVLYGIGMGILSLRARSGGWRALQRLLVILPFVLGLVGIAAVASLFFQDLPVGIRLLAGTAASMVVVFFLSLVWKDIAFLRTGETDRFRRLRRHALRMAIAGAEVVRAPLLSFGPPIGAEGALSFPLYFFGPFLLIPLIYYLAMPTWVKRRDGKSQRAPLAA